MSLPDTVFIFVLALIIFGPKKLPEIGRQLGRLVGEFRRASNEFKFQIEEELRQADFNDKRASQQTIAAPTHETAQIEDGSVNPIFPQSPEDPTENIAVGQHPNIDALDTSALNPSEIGPSGLEGSESGAVDVETANEIVAGEIHPESNLQTVPTITPATDVQPRTKAPYAVTESANGSLDLPFPQQADEAMTPSEIPAPANSHVASNEAEITHG